MRRPGIFLFVLCFLLVLPPSIKAEERSPGSGFLKEEILSSLDLRNIEIKDAIQLIAQRSGLNIVFGENVRGRVTIYLKHVAARQALATVLEMSGLAFEENDGLIKVISDEKYMTKYGRSFSQKVSSRIFRLKGGKASSAAFLLEKLKSPFGRVVADDVSGTIYMEDAPDKIEQAAGYLEQIDRPLVTRGFVLNFLDAESVASRINDVLTKGTGHVLVDRSSNRIVVTDTKERFLYIESFIHSIDVRPQTRIFQLKYSDGEEISRILQRYLTPGFGSIEISPRTNQIVVMDTPEKLEEIFAMIGRIDRQEEEVLIEARIIQVFLKDEFRMGIDWNVVANDLHGLEVKSHWGGVGTESKGSFAVGTLSDNSYRAVVEALGSVNRSQVLSNPRVAVLNNKEARILVGTTKPYVTTTTTTPSSGPVTVSEDVKFIDVGVKLVVTPTIHPDGFITMKIRPEVSSAANSIRTGQNNIIPVVDTSEVETTVRVKDGVTIVIGGLIKDEKGGQEFKVPVLGDIPFVGSLFRNTGRSKEQSEILIFLTPRVISGDLI